MRTVYDISGTTISITTFTLYGSQKKEKQRRDWKCIWGNDTWKLPKLEKGNTYPGTKSMCMHASSLQSGPTLCNPMDYSPPVSSVHGIPEARILEWVACAVVDSWTDFMVGEMSRRVESIYEEVTLFIYFIFTTFYFILEYSQLIILW